MNNITALPIILGCLIMLYILILKVIILYVPTLPMFWIGAPWIRFNKCTARDNANNFYKLRNRAAKRRSTTCPEEKPLNINGMLSSIKELISKIGKWIHFNLSEMPAIYTGLTLWLLTSQHLANVTYNQELVALKNICNQHVIKFNENIASCTWCSSKLQKTTTASTILGIEYISYIGVIMLLHFVGFSFAVHINWEPNPIPWHTEVCSCTMEMCAVWGGGGSGNLKEEWGNISDSL